MSILLSWVCLNSYAQLPYPNDTLENGKKVPFNQFLGRFSVFNELGGAAFYYSFNVGYSLIKTNLVTTDLTVGASRIQYGQYAWRDESLDSYYFPIGLSTYIGRRRSRLKIRLGYSARIYPSWYSDKESPYPNCAGVCPTPPQHSLFFSLGYTYQNQYGFFAGINANAIMTFPLKEDAERFGSDPYVIPWPGLVLGYRLPSKQLHREWTERSFKRRVLRLEEPREKKKKDDDMDDIFYGDDELEIDSADMMAIEAKLSKLKKRHERYLREEQRLNGRSHVFLEGFGAAGFWSVNYSYTHPIGKSKTFAMDYRGGYGTDSEDMALPLAIGVKAMKNYRGTGLFIGAMPRYNWTDGKVGFVYFLQHNVEFHFAYGLTGGVSFYYLFDPTKFLFSREWAAYGGLFLGYRLPQMKKA